MPRRVKTRSLPDVVIRHIFQYVDSANVLKCRGINKEWKALGTGYLKDKMNNFQVVLDSTDSIRTLQNSDLIWTNFCLHDFDLTSCDATELFNKIGSSIKKIKLDYTENSSEMISAGSFSELIRNKVPLLDELEIKNFSSNIEYIFPVKNLPSLELQKLTIRDGLSKFYDKPIFIESIFKSVPNLTSLVIDFPRKQLETVTFLSKFAEFGNVKNLTELDISLVTEKVMTLLNEKYKDAPVKKFIAGSIDDDNPPRELLDDFIEDKSETLEVLRLGFGFLRLYSLPCMENLVELSIRVGCSAWEDEVYDSDDEENAGCYFIWGDQFPNLVTVNLVDDGTAYASGFSGVKALFNDSEATPCFKVKNLTIPPELKEEDMERIGYLFPNALKVTVPLQTDVGVFHHLWKNWPNLKTLILSNHYFDIETRRCGMQDSDDDSEDYSDDSLHHEKCRKKACKACKNKRQKLEDQGGKSFDSILTGFPDESLKLIKKSGKNGKPKMTAQEIENLRIHPSILNMKELNHLIFYDGWLSNYAHKRSSITEFTLDFALSRLKGLKSVLFPSTGVAWTMDSLDNFCNELNLKRNPNTFEMIEFGRHHFFMHFVREGWEMKNYRTEDNIVRDIPDYL